jgi:hypothetical protein
MAQRASSPKPKPKPAKPTMILVILVAGLLGWWLLLCFIVARTANRAALGAS